MSEVKIFKLYEAIKHLEFAAGEIVRSGVDEKFEREVVNSIDNVIELTSKINNYLKEKYNIIETTLQIASQNENENCNI